MSRLRNTRLLVLYNEQAGKCAYCHEDMTLELSKPNTATKDHIIPKSLIGSALKEFNLVAACRDCNLQKADLKLSQFIGLMLSK